MLNQGRVVERGETKQVLQHPQDDYTVALLDAVADAAPLLAQGKPEEFMTRVALLTQDA